jgi:AGCS family alanine or glycine:cation symporter
VFTALNISPAICGAVFFVITLYLSFGGGERISRFTVRLIPPLCLAYVVLSLAVIFILRKDIPYVTSVILSDAFTPRAGVGGALGFLSSAAVRYGITRGIMSNEAGCGTAPFAHAGADTDSPVRQGMFGIIEVACDTLILCTLSAYVILLSGSALTGSATEIAINSFTSVLGNNVRLFLGISIFLFALGSVVGWCFYGQESVKALGLGKRSLGIYGAVLSVSAFLGCIMPENTVWELADISISVMAVINMTAVLLLSDTVVRITRGKFYKVRRGRRGKGMRH